jgi:hypothetical protein
VSKVSILLDCGECRMGFRQLWRLFVLSPTPEIKAPGEASAGLDAKERAKIRRSLPGIGRLP